MANTRHPPRIRGLSEIAGNYRYLLCDAWGVLHNGVTAYAEAVDALIHARAAGLRVLVLTNAPRPKAEVVKQFDRFGVDHRGYNDIVTSGDATREYLATRPEKKALFVGADRDRGVLDGIGIDLVGQDEAELIACIGLYDDTTETPDDYTGRMRDWLARGLPLICANPDKVVERGHVIVWCAGALAAKYAGMGGRTVVLGKPHAPIYESALRRFGEIAGTPVDPAEVLAIGDAAETDLRGANDAGLDVLFVTAGIHAERLGERHEPDGPEVSALLSEHGLGARAYIPHLAW
ncbi:MAG: TIGR01459 family HAD-type hydrolase [Bauldia sp.]|nr:TIGR01459 family HAD-type hydrolase [Bauldia sp.]